MKKILFIIISIVIVFVVVNLLKSEPDENNIINVYRDRWGLNLPLPEERIEVWRSKADFHGDGEWFNIFLYPIDNQSVMNGLTKISVEDIEGVEEKVKKFKAETLSIYNGNTNQSQKVKDAFNKYPIQVAEGDFFYYKEENNEFDYFLALYKANEGKLYTFEWHQ